MHFLRQTMAATRPTASRFNLMANQRTSFLSCSSTPARWFANINYDAIKPENSVLKLYQDLVTDGQIKEDPK